MCLSDLLDDSKIGLDEYELKDEILIFGVLHPI